MEMMERMNTWPRPIGIAHHTRDAARRSASGNAASSRPSRHAATRAFLGGAPVAPAKVREWERLEHRPGDGLADERQPTRRPGSAGSGN
jgi:hypothetical protein